MDKRRIIASPCPENIEAYVDTIWELEPMVLLRLEFVGLEWRLRELEKCFPIHREGDEPTFTVIPPDFEKFTLAALVWIDFISLFDPEELKRFLSEVFKVSQEWDCILADISISLVNNEGMDVTYAIAGDSDICDREGDTTPS